MSPLTLLYRGPLAGCNYGCGYCPFAKRVDTRRQLERDREMLARFVGRVAEVARRRPLRVMFTPWGEALIRRHYREAVVTLSRAEGVVSVAAQTNLSRSPGWLADADPGRVKVWATYHPGETPLERFADRVRAARDAGVGVSAGMVAVPGGEAEAWRLRRAVPGDVFVWLNPQQPRRRAFTADEVASLSRIDPEFAAAVRRRRSRGLPCRAGEESLSVDGRGRLRRCHFVGEVIGNLYEADWESCLRPRPCPRGTCDCHLGFTQLRGYESVVAFAGDPVARVPAAGGPGGAAAIDWTS